LSAYDPIIKLNCEQLSFAICYDIEIDEHIISARKRKSSTYVASIFYSLEGINSGIQRLNKISTEYHMDILMANYVGNCWNTCAGGKSLVFDEYGAKIIEGDSHSECLLIAEKNNENWIGKKIIL
jgi:predicted amidohydrolase